MARVAIGGFRHGTNSFAPTLATYEEFERGSGWPPMTRGATLFAAVAGCNLALSGFIDAARALGHDLVPTLWAAAGASGPVTRDAYERVAGMLLEDIAEQGPFDAICLDLHGAMAAEHLEDGEGELLRRLRALAGPDLPVVATLDLHANVTPAMVRHASALVAGRTFPQIDRAETGRRAARHLDALLRGSRAMRAGFRRLPFLIPLIGSCTLAGPGAAIIGLLRSLETGPVASLSFAAGFPTADVADCGPSLLGYGADQAAVDAALERLAGEILRREAEWAGGRLLDPDAAVTAALKLAQGAARPVLLADVQDDPGAGGTGDTMGLLKALLRHGAEGAALGLVYDPHVATVAHRCGEGADIAVCLGGKHGVAGDSSLDATFTVAALGDGHFACTGPVYGGARMELAPIACLRIGGVRVVVAGKRVQAADRAMFRHVGIEPARETILALKSAVQFRADFEPIAAAVLLTAAPGAAVADPAKLPFTRLRPGMRLGPMGPAFGGGGMVGGG